MVKLSDDDGGDQILPLGQLVDGISLLHPTLSQLRPFEIDRSIWAFATDIVVGHIDDLGGNPLVSEICTPVSSRLPFDQVYFAVEGFQVMLCRQGSEIRILLGYPRLDLLATWVPGQPMKFPLKFHDPVQVELAGALLRIPFCVALINEPRIVRHVPAVSRQQRRAAERSGKFAGASWTRIMWDVTKPTVAKSAAASDCRCMPLHWVRGHWKRALPHFKGACLRPDALKPEDRMIWWQWIDGFVRGHAYFGIRKSVHAPTASCTFREHEEAQ